jgi:hypothetical protein
VGQELVGNGKFLTIGAITNHQQPARHSLFQKVHAIAGHGLRDLRQERQRVSEKPLVQLAFAFELRADDPGFDSPTGAGDLRDRSLLCDRPTFVIMGHPLGWPCVSNHKRPR